MDFPNLIKSEPHVSQLSSITINSMQQMQATVKELLFQKMKANLSIKKSIESSMQCLRKNSSVSKKISLQSRMIFTIASILTVAM